MGIADDWKEIAHRTADENRRLIDRCAALESKLNDERRHRLIAEMNLKFAKVRLSERGDNVMDNFPPTTYGGDPRAPWNAPDDPQCLNCGADIDAEWRYCPYCGEVIDWVEINKEEWWS